MCLVGSLSLYFGSKQGQTQSNLLQWKIQWLRNISLDGYSPGDLEGAASTMFQHFLEAFLYCLVWA